MLDAPAVADIFAHYMRSENNPVSAAEFTPNLSAKMNHAGFLSDTPPLLRPGIRYDAKEAADWLTRHLIPHTHREGQIGFSLLQMKFYTTSLLLAGG